MSEILNLNNGTEDVTTQKAGVLKKVAKGAAVGLALLAGGGYFIYKKIKNLDANVSESDCDSDVICDDTDGYECEPNYVPAEDNESDEG